MIIPLQQYECYFVTGAYGDGRPRCLCSCVCNNDNMTHQLGEKIYQYECSIGCGWLCHDTTANSTCLYSEDGSNNSGWIVGGVIGGVAALILTGTCFYLACRHRGSRYLPHKSDTSAL
jgi:hypothetical protein